ncbi:hypothetical protein [Pontibacillus halophilus]|nr:hypothetical protein [Pontibacillus halophilus]
MKTVTIKDPIREGITDQSFSGVVTAGSGEEIYCNEPFGFKSIRKNE